MSFLNLPLRWTKGLLKFGWSLLINLVLATMLVWMMMRAPTVHKTLLRAYVGPSVFYAYPTGESGGGGTAFSITAPSGKTYFVTNDHICVESKNGLVQLKSEDGKTVWVKIIDRSLTNDLCLLESLASVRGLSIASKVFVGEQVVAIGHPDLFSIYLFSIHFG